MRSIGKFFLYAILLILAMIFSQNILIQNDKSKVAPEIVISDDRKLGIDDSWNLPVISAFINSESEESNEIFWLCELYVYQDFDENERLINEPSQLLKAEMKYRGSSSKAFPKKQYGIEFYGKNSEMSLLGLPEGEEWVFSGPFLDKTAIREKLMYDLSNEIFEWSPKSTYFELFLDGEYKGVYLLIEKIDESENRLDLTSFSLLNGESPFIIKRDRFSETYSPENDSEKLQVTFGGENFYTHDNLLYVHPSRKDITNMQKKWIHRYINDFETNLYSPQFSSQFFGYNQYVDVENFVDYYVINLFSSNKDAGDFSTYFYKDFDKKLKITVWDFNNSFGLYHEMTYISIDNEVGNWFERLLEDENFRDKVVKRYQELRLTLLSDESIDERIDRYQTQISSAMVRDYRTWQYQNEVLISDGQVIVKDDVFFLNKFQSNIEVLKSFVKLRAEFLDQNIEGALNNQFSNKE